MSLNMKFLFFEGVPKVKCILSVSLHLGTNSEIYFSFCPLPLFLSPRGARLDHFLSHHKYCASIC